MLVVYFHTEYELLGRFKGFGSFGVNIFFIVSGFIMARICDVDSRAFFRRRLIRILPLYWALTSLSFLAALLFPDLMHATRASVTELIESVLFIPFVKSDGLMEPMLAVGWTLNYEMFFYAIVAVSLWVSQRSAHLITVLLLLGVMGASKPFVDSSAIAAFYSAPVVLHFVAGTGVYYLYKWSSRVLCERVRPYALLALTVSFTGLVLIEVFRPSQSTLIGACSCLLVTSALLLSKGGWDFAPRPLILIGDASYALYLAHPFVVTPLNRLVAPHVPFLSSKEPVGMIVALIMSALVAIGIYVWLERPITALLKVRFLDHRPQLRDRQTSTFGVLAPVERTLL